MGTAELFLLAVGLSMAALAVALCKGLALGKLDLGRALWVGLWFGGFQGLMPLAGWALGAGFARSIAAIDHWVAFLLLGWLGGNMLCTARADEPEDSSAALDLRAMLPLAVATSIDALAVGVSMAFMSVHILASARGHSALGRLDRFDHLRSLCPGRGPGQPMRPEIAGPCQSPGGRYPHPPGHQDPLGTLRCVLTRAR